MFDTGMLGPWLVGSLLFLILLFFFKNGKKQQVGRFLRVRGKTGVHKRKRLQVSEYLRHLRTLVFKPKIARAFLPLVILFLVVLLLINNYVYFTVITSDSMAPTFNRGDMVLMTEFTDIEEGDVIMFSTPQEQMPVVHRVSEIQGDEIRTKGDFNPREDSWTINESAVYSEAVELNGKPVVLKGVGTYFLEDYESHGRYSKEVEFNRLLLSGMQDVALYIFIIAVTLYIYLTIREHRERRI